MGIIYIFEIIHAPDVEQWPPSIKESDWFKQFTNFHNAWFFSREPSPSIIGRWFPTEEAAQQWSNDNKLTDPALLSDLEAWKTAHNISYNHYFYNVPENTTITGPV